MECHCCGNEGRKISRGVNLRSGDYLLVFRVEFFHEDTVGQVILCSDCQSKLIKGVSPVDLIGDGDVRQGEDIEAFRGC
jgi:hypothetical protein